MIENVQREIARYISEDLASYKEFQIHRHYIKSHFRKSPTLVQIEHDYLVDINLEDIHDLLCLVLLIKQAVVCNDIVTLIEHAVQVFDQPQPDYSGKFRDLLATETVIPRNIPESFHCTGAVLKWLKLRQSRTNFKTLVNEEASISLPNLNSQIHQRLSSLKTKLNAEAAMASPHRPDALVKSNHKVVDLKQTRKATGLLSSGDSAVNYHLDWKPERSTELQLSGKAIGTSIMCVPVDQIYADDEAENAFFNRCAQLSRGGPSDRALLELYARKVGAQWLLTVISCLSTGITQSWVRRQNPICETLFDGLPTKIVSLSPEIEDGVSKQSNAFFASTWDEEINCLAEDRGILSDKQLNLVCQLRKTSQLGTAKSRSENLLWATLGGDFLSIVKNLEDEKWETYLDAACRKLHFDHMMKLSGHHSSSVNANQSSSWRRDLVGLLEMRISDDNLAGVAHVLRDHHANSRDSFLLDMVSEIIVDCGWTESLKSKVDLYLIDPQWSTMAKLAMLETVLTLGEIQYVNRSSISLNDKSDAVEAYPVAFGSTFPAVDEYLSEYVDLYFIARRVTVVLDNPKAIQRAIELVVQRIKLVQEVHKQIYILKRLIYTELVTLEYNPQKVGELVSNILNQPPETCQPSFLLFDVMEDLANGLIEETTQLLHTEFTHEQAYLQYNQLVNAIQTIVQFSRMIPNSPIVLEAYAQRISKLSSTFTSSSPNQHAVSIPDCAAMQVVPNVLLHCLSLCNYLSLSALWMENYYFKNMRTASLTQNVSNEEPVSLWGSSRRSKANATCNSTPSHKSSQQHCFGEVIWSPPMSSHIVRVARQTEEIPVKPAESVLLYMKRQLWRDLVVPILESIKEIGLDAPRLFHSTVADPKENVDLPIDFDLDLWRHQNYRMESMPGSNSETVHGPALSNYFNSNCLDTCSSENYAFSLAPLRQFDSIVYYSFILPLVAVGQICIFPTICQNCGAMICSDTADEGMIKSVEAWLHKYVEKRISVFFCPLPLEAEVADILNSSEIDGRRASLVEKLLSASENSLPETLSLEHSLTPQRIHWKPGQLLRILTARAVDGSTRAVTVLNKPTEMYKQDYPLPVSDLIEIVRLENVFMLREEVRGLFVKFGRVSHTTDRVTKAYDINLRLASLFDRLFERAIGPGCMILPS